ncbi:hypothetical protein PG985_008591 [Apiospora marii]|uniref:uncharacterized protein n=1 Tax=Apiospora marii TaxID=335849 RepID=UPI0031323B7E
MSNQQNPEFHFFSKLPPELRRMIWDYAVAEPRVVHTKGFYDRATKRWKSRGTRITVYPRFSPLHDTCHEARRAFLASPGLVRETDTEKGFGVAWHPDRDFLMCHDTSANKRRRFEYGYIPWWDAIDLRNNDFRNGLQDPARGRYSVRNIMFDLYQFHNIWTVTPGRRLFPNGHPTEDVEGNMIGGFPNARIMKLVPGAKFRPATRTTRASRRETVLKHTDDPVDFKDAWETINELRGDGPKSTVGSDRIKLSGSISCRLSSR